MLAGRGKGLAQSRLEEQRPFFFYCGLFFSLLNLCFEILRNPMEGICLVFSETTVQESQLRYFETFTIFAQLSSSHVRKCVSLTVFSVVFVTSPCPVAVKLSTL